MKERALLFRYLITVAVLTIGALYASANTQLSLPEPPDPMEEEEEHLLYLLDNEERAMTDSIIGPVDHSLDEKRNWWRLLKRGELSLSDTTVRYPRFLKFCLNVYKWADKTFNSYDTTYVEGTGRRWKARLLCDNWNDSYYINPGKKLPIRVISDPYSNIGAYIQYMAVSIGYSLDLNSIIAKNTARHRKLEYTFSCARFNIEGHWWQNYGRSFIRTFGDYHDGRIIKEPFDGVRLNNLEIYGYYFFNNRKYSQGASYNFSKFQRKSAGSAIIGLGYSNTNISLDLNLLPDDLKPYLSINPDIYKFHYRSYYLISGYGFNWVWNKHFLFNASVFPGIGVNFMYADNSSGQDENLAMNVRAMSSITYNLKDFFVCGVVKFDGSWYISDSNTLFSSVQNAQVSVGLRF